MQVSIEKYDLEKEAIRRSRGKLEQSLSKFSHKWLKENYGVTLTHDIKINARTTKTLGCVTIGYNGIESIELSEVIILDYRLTGDSSKMIGVLKHELIHYALYKLGKPYGDSDRYFKEQCKLHNATLGVNGISGMIHAYECAKGHKINRKRKIDTKVYTCECDSELEYKGRKVILR